MDTEIDSGDCRECTNGLQLALDYALYPRAVVSWYCPRHGVVDKTDAPVSEREDALFVKIEHMRQAWWELLRYKENERVIGHSIASQMELNDALRAEIEALRAVLLGYERWEDDVLTDFELSPPFHDALMRLQSERNAALKQEHPA